MLEPSKGSETSEGCGMTDNLSMRLLKQAERHFLVMVDDGVFTDPVEGGHEV